MFLNQQIWSYFQKTYNTFSIEPNLMNVICDKLVCVSFIQSEKNESWGNQCSLQVCVNVWPQLHFMTFHMLLTHMIYNCSFANIFGQYCPNEEHALSDKTDLAAFVVV